MDIHIKSIKSKGNSKFHKDDFQRKRRKMFHCAMEKSKILIELFPNHWGALPVAFVVTFHMRLHTQLATQHKQFFFVSFRFLISMEFVSVTRDVVFLALSLRSSFWGRVAYISRSRVLKESSWNEKNKANNQIEK